MRDNVRRIPGQQSNSPVKLYFLFATAVLATAQPAYDLIISGGRVMDGTGSAWFYGDVAIRGDRIVRVVPAGLLKDAPTKERLDARGMVVAPGFIDIQGQSQGALLNGDGRLISKITQGVTTEIMGEGSTLAPANDRILATQADDNARRNLGRFTGPRAFGNWLDAMGAHGSSVNLGSFVGQTTLRMYGKGMAQGAPTEAELDDMRGALKRAMEDGAFGMASALIYPPGEYTTTRELVELGKVMAPFGGVYITHMRSEADRLLEAIDEAIEVGRAGVGVEIYHLKAAGTANWPKMALAIDKINAARRAGIDISADMYPYLAGGTGLTVCLPPWASADGKLFDNLADPKVRARIKDETLSTQHEWENICQQSTPAGVLIARMVKPENAQYAGKRLDEIARMKNKDWAEAAMDLILSERSRVETMFFIASEDNLKLQLRQPWIKFGSDASGIDPAMARGLAHPRAYGNFTRVLGKYVREEKVIPLEDAIRKMTSATANRLSLQDRGLVREGLFADIVVFDPETVGDRATYENPHQLSVGIRDVFVNGVAVVKAGQVTGAKPGRVVRGPGYVAK
jgi:dihydroorotase/N-acyl-D-amino-acid deacylase